MIVCLWLGFKCTLINFPFELHNSANCFEEPRHNYLCNRREKRWPPSTCALRRCVRDLWCPLPVVGEVSTLTASALWITLSNPPMTSDLCCDSEARSWGVLIPFRVVGRRWALRLLAVQPEEWTVPRSGFESWMWTRPKRKSIHLVHWLLTTLLTYLFTRTQTIRIKEWWDKNASCKHVKSKWGGAGDKCWALFHLVSTHTRFF